MTIQTSDTYRLQIEYISFIADAFVKTNNLVAKSIEIGSFSQVGCNARATAVVMDKFLIGSVYLQVVKGIHSNSATFIGLKRENERDFIKLFVVKGNDVIYLNDSDLQQYPHLSDRNITSMQQYYDAHFAADASDKVGVECTGSYPVLLKSNE